MECRRTASLCCYHGFYLQEEKEKEEDEKKKRRQNVRCDLVNMIALKIAHTYERAITDEIGFNKPHHIVDVDIHLITLQDNLFETFFERLQFKLLSAILISMIE